MQIHGKFIEIYGKQSPSKNTSAFFSAAQGSKKVEYPYFKLLS